MPTKQRIVSDTKDIDIILLALEQETGFAWQKELRFHPERRWRFDYACPDRKVAVEIEGNVFNYGRHNNPMGFVKDCEKYGVATSMGWKVLRFTPPTTKEPTARFGTEMSWNIIKHTLNSI